MIQYSEYFADDFAQIFELSIIDDEIDIEMYLHYRDDFYQLIRNNLKHHIETQDEIQARFERMPEIENDIILAYAASTAEYYTRILNLSTPQWCNEVSPIDEAHTPFFPMPRIIDDLNYTIANTPEEFLRRGFIYDEHNLYIA